MQRLILMNRINNIYKIIFSKAILSCLVLIFAGQLLTAQTTVLRLFDEAADLMENGNYKGAIEKYDSVTLFQGTNAKLYYNRALAHINLQNYGKALVDLNKTISLDTAMYDAYFNRAFVNTILKNEAFAIGDYDVYLEQFPDDPEALLARGKLFLRQEEAAKAIVDLKKYTLKNTTNEEAYLALFFAYKMQNKIPEALSAIDAAINIKSYDAKFHQLKADVLFDEKRYTEACVSYDKVLGIQRNNIEVMVSKASAKFQLGLMNDAVVAMESAISYDASNPDHYYDKAFYLLQAKRYTEVHEVADLALKHNYNDIGAVHFLKAIAYNNLGFAESACTSFTLAAKFGNKEAVAYAKKLCEEE